MTLPGLAGGGQGQRGLVAGVVGAVLAVPSTGRGLPLDAGHPLRPVVGLASAAGCWLTKAATPRPPQVESRHRHGAAR